MYAVERRIQNVEIFRLLQSSIYADIAPEWGNNCFQFYSTVPVLEPVVFDIFARRSFSYGIPILLPFPNRIQDGVFTYAGKTYEVNPKQHGFVRDKKWNVLNSGASESEGAWILSEFNASDHPQTILQQFPFPFHATVLYRLREGRLEMLTTMRNTGDAVLPFGFGIHPYFRLPDSGTLQVPANERWELEAFIPTGQILPVQGPNDLRQPKDVHALSLDDIFTDLNPTNGNSVHCILQDDTNRIRTIVEFDQRQFPDVVVFTTPLPRRAIAIEPYTCPTNAFNLQNSGVAANVIELQPGQESKFLISIYTETLGGAG
jgi:aldose 1-epimerase